MDMTMSEGPYTVSSSFVDHPAFVLLAELSPVRHRLAYGSSGQGLLGLGINLGDFLLRIKPGGFRHAGVHAGMHE